MGERAAVSGNHAIFSGPLDEPRSSTNEGIVRVMVRADDGTWSLQTNLLCTTAAANRNFGQGIAFDGNTLVVGEKGATEGEH